MVFDDMIINYASNLYCILRNEYIHSDTQIMLYVKIGRNNFTLNRNYKDNILTKCAITQSDFEHENEHIPFERALAKQLPIIFEGAMKNGNSEFKFNFNMMKRKYSLEGELPLEDEELSLTLKSILEVKPQQINVKHP